MHSPDREAPEEQVKQVEDDSATQQVSPPLDEFSASPDTDVLPETVANSTPVHESTAQGFVYPPPPSYYEKMAMPVQQKPLPGSDNATGAPPWPMPAGTPVYPAPAVPPFMPQPPVKKPRRWVWFVVSLGSAVILATCGLCGWGFYKIFSSTYQQISGSINVVDDFYANLQLRNYHAAYDDLTPLGNIGGLTEKQFSSRASERANTYGPLDSFVLGQPGFTTNPNMEPDLSHFTMSVDVKRSRLSYMVSLSVAKIGNMWKITDYSQL